TRVVRRRRPLRSRGCGRLHPPVLAADARGGDPDGCVRGCSCAARCTEGEDDRAAHRRGVRLMAQTIVETGTPPITPPVEHRLWGGRFDGAPAPSLEELNRSLDVDR